ncbi:MAG: hypothetical protein IPI49_29625 [Myxococcales bacterium]|nr:hypothetical protein [Myxococcales bacterium]
MMRRLLLSATWALVFTAASAGAVLAAPAASQPVPGGQTASKAAPKALPVAPPVERRLWSDAFEASSFLWNDWNRFQENYHPNYVGDDDPKTGWVEGVDGSGAGQWLRMGVTPLENTSRVRLRIRNGYQKSGALYKANARAKDVVVKLLPSGKELSIKLTDSLGWQEVVIEQAPSVIRQIELGIVSVYEGTKYADLVISDIQVFATSLTRDNPAFEKSKRQNLLDWRKARLAAAKLFKAGRAGELPLHSSYRAIPQELDGAVRKEQKERDGGLEGILHMAAADPGFAPWREALAIALELAADLEVMTPAQVSPVDTTSLPAVDGFVETDLGAAAEGYAQEGVLRLPLLGHVSAFSADKLRVLDQKGRGVAAYREDAWGKACRDAAWVKRAKASEATAPDRVVGLLVSRCGEYEGREGTVTVRADQLMVFGKDGKLLLVAGVGYVDAYRWEAGGKIAGGRSMQSDSTVELVKGQLAQK